MSHPLNETILDTSQGDLTRSVEASGLEARSSQLKRVKKTKLNGRGVKRPFNLSLDDDDEETTSSVSPAPLVQPTDFDDSQNSPHLTRANPRGRPPRLPKPGSQVDDFVEESVVEQPAGALEEEAPIQLEEAVVELEQEAEQEAGQEAAEDGDDKEPVQETEEAQVVTKKRKGGKTALSRKDQDAKMKPPPKPKGNPIQQKRKTTGKQPSKPNARSLYVSRSETPAQDSGARTTRAGRNVLKPVAFWRGERIVYGDGLLEGSNLTLPGIKEVIRTEEVAAPMPKRSRYRRSKPTSRGEETPAEAEVEDDEEEEREPWETEAGIVRAQVLQWDSITGRYDEENSEEAGTSQRLRFWRGRTGVFFENVRH